MQGINCVKGEIHNVLTVLRLNSASAAGLYSGVEMAQMEEEEQVLIRGLKELYEMICTQSDLAHVDTLYYLNPFLTVITSKHTDIFTTAIALHSIHKFLVYGLIHAESPNVAAALTQIADSVTHCTFDVTDGEDAEIVSMKILEILLECLRCSAGEFLTDQAVLDMICECFHVRSQQHSSKLLRRYAENVLMQMVLVLFARISPESSNASELYQSRASSPSPALGPLNSSRSLSNAGMMGVGSGRSLSNAMPFSLPSRHRSLSVHSTIKDWNSTTEQSVQKFNASQEGSSFSTSSASHSSSTTGFSSGMQPYGIPALHRVFRFLTNLINPGDVRNTEQDRILGLRLIRTVLETSSTRIGSFPPLITVIQEELCKYLLQNSQSKNLFVLSLTLRIVFDLFITVKSHLKVQLEVFFTSIHLRIGESPSSSFQQKELVLESLVEFCKEVSLIVGLYRNYDVELGCTDLFQDLCKFLANTAMQPWQNSPATTGGALTTASKSAQGGAGTSHPNQLNILSLEGMVAVLNAICKRFCSNYHSSSHSFNLHNRIQEHENDRLPPPSGTVSTAQSGSNPSPINAPFVPAETAPSSFSHAGAHHLHSSLSTSRQSSGYTSAGEESEDDESTLILSPEEEAHLMDKRANKQKLALAADQFNREGLSKQTIKLLQSLQILPPSVVPEGESNENSAEASTNAAANNASSAASAASISSTSTNSTSTTGNETSPSNADTNTPSPGSSANSNAASNTAAGDKKKAKFVAKSKHDPGIAPIHLVNFFRNTPGLDKEKIGAYLGDADIYNIKVLDCFVETFDFSAVPKSMPNTNSVALQLANPLESDDGELIEVPSSISDAVGISAPDVDSISSPSGSNEDISLDDALRSFLDTFKLPGESQQIARIIERFSTAYYQHCKGPLKSADAAYVLCYSVIMLNTDAHNSQVTRKMTKEMYCRNLRGINEREDLPKEYLEKLYDSIVNNEIKIKSDNIKDMAKGNGVGADWHRVFSTRSKGGPGGVGGSFQISTARIHGKEMFLLIWQQSISMFIHYLENHCAAREGWMLPLNTNLELLNLNLFTLSSSSLQSSNLMQVIAQEFGYLNPRTPTRQSRSSSFAGTTPPTPSGSTASSSTNTANSAYATLHQDHVKLLPKIMQGFHLFCRICAVYNLNEQLNNLIIALCKCLIGLFEELCIEANWEAIEIQMAFARDIRLTHLLHILFQILHEYGESHVHESWSNCVHVLLWLRQMELLPSNWLEMEDFRDSGGKPLESLRFTGNNPHTPNPHRRTERVQKEAQGGGGFWSWLSSGSGNSNASNQSKQSADGHAPPSLTPLQQTWVSRARDLVALCRIPQLFESSKYFRSTPLTHLVRSLILISSSGTKSLSSLAAAAYSAHIINEESAVFCLERLADLIEKNQARLNPDKEQHTTGTIAATPHSLSTPSASSSSTTMLPSPNSSNATSSSSSLQLWSTISQHFELSIHNVRNDDSCSFYIERLVVNLLRFSVRLVYHKETTQQLIQLLALLLQLSPATFATLGPRIIAGTSLFLQTHGESISTVQEWEVVFKLLLLFKDHPFSAHSAFQTFTYIVDNHCNSDIFLSIMRALTHYAQNNTDNGKEVFLPVAAEAVISLLLRLHSKIPTLPLIVDEVPSTHSHPHLPPDSLTPAQAKQLLSASQAAKRQHTAEQLKTDLWLMGLNNFCIITKDDARSNVRKSALEALSNALLAAGGSPPVAPIAWRHCFEQLLLPLLDGVQRYAPDPNTPKKSSAPAPSKNSNTPSRTQRQEDPVLPPYDLRLKTATLIFQTFLHHLDVICSMKDFSDFWLHFIHSLARYMATPNTLDSKGADFGRGSLSLHISESLKNLLLVMHASGIFDAISSRTGVEDLLPRTWSILESVKPELRQQLEEHLKQSDATERNPRRAQSQQPPVQPQQQQPQQQPQQQAQMQPAHPMPMNPAVMSHAPAVSSGVIQPHPQQQVHHQPASAQPLAYPQPPTRQPPAIPTQVPQPQPQNPHPAPSPPLVGSGAPITHASAVERVASFQPLPTQPHHAPAHQLQPPALHAPAPNGVPNGHPAPQASHAAVPPASRTPQQLMHPAAQGQQHLQQPQPHQLGATKGPIQALPVMPFASMKLPQPFPQLPFNGPPPAANSNHTAASSAYQAIPTFPAAQRQASPFNPPIAGPLSQAMSAAGPASAQASRTQSPAPSGAPLPFLPPTNGFVGAPPPFPLGLPPFQPLANGAAAPPFPQVPFKPANLPPFAPFQPNKPAPVGMAGPSKPLGAPQHAELSNDNATTRSISSAPVSRTNSS